MAGELCELLCVDGPDGVLDGEVFASGLAFAAVLVGLGCVVVGVGVGVRDVGDGSGDVLKPSPTAEIAAGTDLGCPLVWSEAEAQYVPNAMAVAAAKATGSTIVTRLNSLMPLHFAFPRHGADLTLFQAPRAGVKPVAVWVTPPIHRR